VPLAQWAVFSEPGLRAYAPGQSQDEALMQARESGADVAMVTLGARGVRWMDRAGMHQIPGFAVQAVDTTGAGDVFHGGLMMALAEGKPPGDAIRFACAAAALKCERPHGVMGTPSRAEVDEFMKKMGSGPCIY
jgi:sulfofructose kinase